MTGSDEMFADDLHQPFVPADRVFYATGVLLDAKDFKDEQKYSRGRLARTLAYLHGTGTVAGLKVTLEPHLVPGDDPDFPEGREERLRVDAGLAVDRLGRLIEVPDSVCLRLGNWYDQKLQKEPDDLLLGVHEDTHFGVTVPDDLHTELGGGQLYGLVADVFARFFVCPSGKTPAFASGPFDALDAVQPSRLRDSYDMELIIRKEDNPPLPVDPWSGLDGVTGAEERRAALHELIFDAWKEGTAHWDAQGNPVPLPEHALGQDTTSVFLARVIVFTTDADTTERVDGLQVLVSNEPRLFVYTPNALAHWLA